jgi:hypothetical protein
MLPAGCQAVHKVSLTVEPLPPYFLGRITNLLLNLPNAANSAIRDRNTIIAIRLLPIFEAEPRGWEAAAFLQSRFRQCE